MTGSLPPPNTPKENGKIKKIVFNGVLFHIAPPACNTVAMPMPKKTCTACGAKCSIGLKVCACGLKFKSKRITNWAGVKIPPKANQHATEWGHHPRPRLQPRLSSGMAQWRPWWSLRAIFHAHTIRMPTLGTGHACACTMIPRPPQSPRLFCRRRQRARARAGARCVAQVG